MGRPRAGEPAPDFTLPDESGAPWRLADQRGRFVVLFFYPKDETPGCIAESCGFRDEFREFDERGATVVGVSRDSPESHRAFKARRRLPYPLLSDPDARVIRDYGALGLFGLPKRVTFLIDGDGVVRDVHSSQLRPAGHADRMLEEIEALRKEKEGTSGRGGASRTDA